MKVLTDREYQEALRTIASKLEKHSFLIGQNLFFGDGTFIVYDDVKLGMVALSPESNQLRVSFGWYELEPTPAEFRAALQMLKDEGVRRHGSSLPFVTVLSDRCEMVATFGTRVVDMIVEQAQAVFGLTSLTKLPTPSDDYKFTVRGTEFDLGKVYAVSTGLRSTVNNRVSARHGL
jgi:hypothetical protein